MPPRLLQRELDMSEYVSTALVVLVVALFALALYAMAVGRLAVAGLCFLSASIVIYLRETRLQDGGE